MSIDGAGDSPSLMNAWPQEELAVVIGAGGMSMAVARRLGQRNRLLICDIDAGRLQTQTAKLHEDGMQVDTVVCDVTDPASVAALAARIKALGGFSRLAHVAGLSPGMADWHTILAVNLKSPALVTEALFPLAKTGSAAVLISSLSAYMATPDKRVIELLDKPADPDLPARLNEVIDGNMSSQLAYMLSKVGVTRLAQRLAISWGGIRARINSVSPGLIASPQGLGEFKHSPTKYQLLNQCPLQRQGNMQEIADAVEFLTSKQASYINGIDLLIDGGLNATRLQAQLE